MLINVQCPHCGSQGQLNLPGINMALIGNCPDCNKVVLIFLGSLYPMDEAIIFGGTSKQKVAHIWKAIGEVLKPKIQKFIDGVDMNYIQSPPEARLRQVVDDPLLADPVQPEFNVEQAAQDLAKHVERECPGLIGSTPRSTKPLISENEMKRFKADLDLLDNGEAFKILFGSSSE